MKRRFAHYSVRKSIDIDYLCMHCDDMHKYESEHAYFVLFNRINTNRLVLKLVEDLTNNENIHLKKLELESGIDYIVKCCMN